MLFLARFSGDLAPILVDAADVDEATARIEEETGGTRPAVLVDVPPGLFCAEVQFKFSDDEDGDDEPFAVQLDPFADVAEWIAAIDDADLPGLDDDEAGDGADDAL